jgi:GNAT superfamily N-acetyltransferase
VKIRDLEERHIPQVLSLAGLMHEESQYRDLTFDPERVLALCTRILVEPEELGLVAQYGQRIIGMLGAYLAPYEQGDELLAYDRLVYVSPGYRGSSAFVRLVRKYVAWAESHGARQIFLSQSTGIKTYQTHQLYQRLGFDPVGSIARMTNVRSETTTV